MNRAYTRLSIKATDDDKRLIYGIATDASVDRIGDVVDPKGAKFRLPLPLLWQHERDKPIGHVLTAAVTKRGIEVVAQLVKIPDPGPLRDRLDEAWASLKSGLVRGLSIGFKPLGEPERTESGYRFKTWEWLELSCVTIAANASAGITAIKAADKLALKRGRDEQHRNVRPGCVYLGKHGVIASPVKLLNPYATRLPPVRKGRRGQGSVYLRNRV